MKKSIMRFLNEAVAELYSGIMVYSEETSSSFFCDFDMAEPLDPEKIRALSERLSGEEIAGAYELSSFSGVYEQGDASRKVLQRIYVTAFDTVEELRVHKAELAEGA